MSIDARTLNRTLATNFSNTLKGLYIMNKWFLSHLTWKTEWEKHTLTGGGET